MVTLAEYNKVCKVCGKEFIAASHMARYCDECRRKNSPVKGEKICPICGKEVFRSKQAKYCSLSCAWKAKQEKSQKNNTSKLSKNGTLCWHCEWSTGKEGKCPWASHLIPVKGWEVKKVKLKVSTTDYTDSYVVKDCPLFEEG